MMGAHRIHPLLTTCLQTLAIACLGCSTSLLTTLSKRQSENGAYSYSPPAVIVTAECWKAAISLGLLMRPTRARAAGGLLLLPPHHPLPPLWPSRPTALRLLALAILYALQNNLLFAALTQVNLATYQVLISLRIPLTAGLMWLMLGRSFSQWHQGAIACLVVGAVASQVDVGALMISGGQLFVITPLGLAYMVTTVACASLASVANETMLKDESAGSLHGQNCVLYGWGCMVNALVALAMGPGRGWTSLAAVYQGFNPYTWALVASLTCLGLATAAILKHADNMVRSLGYVGSIVLASAVSAVLLGTPLSPTFAVGAGVACVGIVGYMVGPPEKKGAVLGRQVKAQSQFLHLTAASFKQVRLAVS